MNVHSLVAASLLSALFVSADALAQTRKPAPKPATAPRSTAPAAKPAPAPAGTRLTTNLDSLSYSVGMSMAQSMKQQGLSNVNTAALAQGINDVLKGQSMLLTPEQSERVLMAYMQQQHAVRAAENQKVAEANKKVSNAFLAENKTKAGVKTTASGLQYIVEKEGTGPKPAATDKVKVHYTGRLVDGKVFDSSVERGQPTEFPVNGVISGWTEALQLMPVGSKWKIFLPSELAYGDRGAGEEIAPGSALIFDVELLEIVK